MRTHLSGRFSSIRQEQFCVYAACSLLWLICCSVSTYSSHYLPQRTTIKGEVRTIEGTAPPGATVVVLKHKKNEPACETCKATVKRDGSYRLETSLPPGPYTLMAYDGKQYTKDEENKELKDGLNDNVNFTLGTPSARVTVRGTTSDPSGAVLPSATVILYAYGCNICEIARTTSNEQGEYVFTDLAGSETYLVAKQASGFSLAYETLEVSDKSEQRIDLAFQVGRTSETVTVTADNLKIDSERTSFTLTALPLESRSVLTLLSPQPDASTRYSSVNGSSPTSVKLTMDGLEIEDTLARSEQSPISLSAIREFSVFQPAYQNAHLSNAPASQIDVSITSGSNEFHGGASYQGMNDALDSRSFFSLPGFDVFRRHIGSGRLSGPIRRDHLFFSFNYEFDRRAESRQFSTILASQISVLNLQLRRLGLPAEDLRRFVTTSAFDSPLLRLDYGVNGTNDFSVMYTFRRDLIRKELSNTLNGTSPTPSTARDFSGRNHLFTFRYTHISPNLVSESSYSFRTNSISIVPAEPDQPSILIAGLALLGRATSLTEGDGHRQRNHEVSERIFITRGKHRMDGGGQFRFDGNVFRFAAFESGRAIVPGLAALSANMPIADLFQVGRGGSQVSFDYSNIAAYFQDDIAINKNLSINLGLRYKAEFPMSPQQKETKGFQPRAGLSWDIRSNQALVLRAGYGLYRSFLPSLPLGFQLLMGGQGLQPVPPARRVTSIVGQPAATIAFSQFLAGGQIPDGPQLATTYDPRSRGPITHNSDVSLSSRLGRNLVLGISYSYRRGTSLLTSTDVNLPPPTVVNGRADFRNTFVNQNFAQIYQFETTGHSSYHGGRLTLGKELSRGLAFNAGYTFSKSIDDVPFLRPVDLVPSASFEATPENVFERRSDRAVSESNPAHSFNMWAIWDVPDPQGTQPSRIRRVLGKLDFTERLQIASGRYFNVVVGSDANRDGNPMTDRPLGVGRNTFLGQRFIRFDASAGSTIPVTEKQRFRIAIQIFNILNRTNFAGYNTVLGQPDLSGLDSRIVSGRHGMPGFDFRQPLAPNGFGLATSDFGPRRVQLEASYKF